MDTAPGGFLGLTGSTGLSGFAGLTSTSGFAVTTGLTGLDSKIRSESRNLDKFRRLELVTEFSETKMID